MKEGDFMANQTNAMATRRVYYMVGLNDAETWGILELGQETLTDDLIATIPEYRGPFNTRLEAIGHEHDIWRDLDAELVLLRRDDSIVHLPSRRYPGSRLIPSGG